ncbi:MAG: DUF58 domain-containing protein [Turicibacter sp.]|nr:DUF58 domain-containing protein [Turicibacter sp.]
MLKNWLAYLSLTSVFIGLLFLYQGPMLFMAVYGLLILPVFSLIIARIQKSRLKLTGTAGQMFLEKQETLQLATTLENGFFMPCLQATVKVAIQKEGMKLTKKPGFCSISPRGQSQASYELTGSLRGSYPIKVEGVFYDMLGLFRQRQRAQDNATVIVAPKPHPIEPLDFGNLALESEGSGKGNQGVRGNISELREFQLTDSYRQIHWKASAKRGKLISKNYEQGGRPSVLVLINNGTMVPADEDALMDYAVSAIRECLALGLAVSIQAMNHPGIGPSTDLAPLFEMAATLQFREPGDFGEFLSRVAASQPPARHILAFSKEDCVQWDPAFQHFSQKGVGVTKFIVKGGSVCKAH